MIDTSGMSPILAVNLINRERKTFEEAIAKEPVSKREIAQFREKIGTVKTVDDLVDNYEVFSFVMKAYGFEDMTFGKALMRRVLVTDPDNKSSLASRLDFGKYKDLTRELGFSEDGTAPEKFGSAEWVDQMVERFIDQRLIDTQTEFSAAVGTALHMQAQAPSLKSWFDVLADEKLAEFMRTALGLPESIGSADLDAQVRLFEKKMDIKDLQDPEKLNKLVGRYTAIRDALDDQSGTKNLTLALFGSSTSSGTWNSVTLDLGSLAGFSASKTR